MVTTDSGKDCCDTQMLKGEASDSLSGTNKTEQYSTGGSPPKGKLGGEPSGE